MTEPDTNEPLPAPGRGIPAFVRDKLKQAVREKLAEHGPRRCRPLLREDPEFSAWIGKTVGKNGETGDKRLDRLIAEVKAEQAIKGRKARAVARFDGVGFDRQGSGSDVAEPELPGGQSTGVGQDEIQRLARQGLAELTRSMAACLGDDGFIQDADDYVKLSRERRATLETIASLGQRFQNLQNNGAFVEALWTRISREFASEPIRRRAVAKDLNAIAVAHGGLPLTTGKTP
jgi:hypothetical protein